MENLQRILEIDEQTRDTILSVLSDERRRTVVAVLAEREATISLSDLVEEIAPAETDQTKADSLKAIKVTLHHRHLPKLDDADVLDYDIENGEITPRDSEIYSAVTERIED